MVNIYYASHTPRKFPSLIEEFYGCPDFLILNITHLTTS